MTNRDNHEKNKRKRRLLILLLLLLLMFLIIIFSKGENTNTKIYAGTNEEIEFYEDTNEQAAEYEEQEIETVEESEEFNFHKIEPTYTEMQKPTNTESTSIVREKESQSITNGNDIENNIYEEENRETEEEWAEEEEIEDIPEILYLQGNIITHNASGKHLANINIYNSDNEAELLSTVLTNDDGTFQIALSAGLYNLVISKPGYLQYTIKQIEINECSIALSEISILGGDFNNDGICNMTDLNAILNRGGLTTDNQGYDEAYDLNGDGIIDETDIDIVDSHYFKKSEVIMWEPDSAEG